MEFSKIISIAGKPGLFQAISQTKSGFIVESLINKKRFPIPSSNNVSLLENIAIYTYEKEVPLLSVFKIMYQKSEGKKVINHKESGRKLETFFSEILPDYDQERVYTSNIKKIIQWYNLLVIIGLDFSIIEVSKENAEQV
tara:strand:- start:7788 stop:8207 length:420 start_codon:yes stop_codon:yes gene_type:complete